MTRHLIPPILILCCVDYRYIQTIQAFVKTRLRVQAYNLKTDAGGTNALLTGHRAVRAWILRNVQLAYERQGVRRVLLFHHQDCLLYGGSRAFATPKEEALAHTQHLVSAAQFLKSRFEGLRVQAFYAYRRRQSITFRAVA